MDLWQALHQGTPLATASPVDGARLVQDPSMKKTPGPPKKPKREEPGAPKVKCVAWVKDRSMWRARVKTSGVEVSSYHEHHADAVAAVKRYKFG